MIFMCYANLQLAVSDYIFGICTFNFRLVFAFIGNVYILGRLSRVLLVGVQDESVGLWSVFVIVLFFGHFVSCPLSLLIFDQSDLWALHSSQIVEH